MKTIGMLGGMSWESTALYYQIINRKIREICGGLHSAKILLHSFDFQEIENLQQQGSWEECGNKLASAAKGLELFGSDFLILCTNTMHLVAPQIESVVKIPLLHIADATASYIKKTAIGKVGLLGTKFTMEKPFYKDRIKERHEIEVITPTDEQRDVIHNIIYNELCQGKIEENSRALYKNIMADLVEQGAQGIILGCTEITILVNSNDATVPLFDTTDIHGHEAAFLACDSKS